MRAMQLSAAIFLAATVVAAGFTEAALPPASEAPAPPPPPPPTAPAGLSAPAPEELLLGPIASRAPPPFGGLAQAPAAGSNFCESTLGCSFRLAAWPSLVSSHLAY